MPPTPRPEIIEKLRNEALDEASVHPDPFKQFQKWYRDARSAGLPQPDAMHLATATREGGPSGRFVIYKDPEEFRLGGEGFPFFTNYESPKSQEIGRNPEVALTFYWAEVGRQVRIRGRAERLPEEVSDRYFKTRPEGSKLGAWASPQSQPLGSRAELMERVEGHRKQFEGEAIPRPPNWGGYRVAPREIEFWQHRDDRLHDRIRYERRSDGSWRIRRLAP